MPVAVTRRALAALPAALPAAGALSRRPAPLGAIAFDAFAIFDPRPALARASAATPGRAVTLGDLWFQKLFAYTWLRTCAQQYAPFETVAMEALEFAVQAMDAGLTRRERLGLVAMLFDLPAWDDAADGLSRWRKAGLRLALLSNMSQPMLEANLQRNRMETAFDAVLSTDLAGAFKPSPAAYRLGPERLGLPASRIGFAAFAGWDAAGASWFGFQTAWVNRTGQAPEAVAAAFETGRNLGAVDALIAQRVGTGVSPR